MTHFRIGLVALVASTVAVAACDESDDGDGWRLEDPPPADDNADTATTPDVLPAPDTPRGDTTGGLPDSDHETCNLKQACCRYFVDLKIRRDNTPARSFTGTVDLGDRTVDFTCPSSEDHSDYRCNYIPVDAADEEAVTEGSVRIAAGPLQRVPVEEIEAEVTSGRGRYQGLVKLGSYSTRPPIGENEGRICRGSLGSIYVDNRPPPEEFGTNSTLGPRCRNGESDGFVFRLGPDASCRTSGETPYLQVDVDDELPSPEETGASLAYRFGPDRPEARGELCRDVSCQQVSGALLIEQYAAGEAAAGYWTARTPDGERIEGRFSATECTFRTDCD